ncbi:MAG: ABC transporter substrate-binding protein [Clostridiales bacterium]|nr:ABC transporter substrate-binding protein [Clostridiales bacterium]
MKIKRIALILALAMLIGSLSACGYEPRVETPEPEKDDSQVSGTDSVYTRSHYADKIFSLNCDLKSGLNPYETTSTANMDIAPLLYEGLFELKDDFSFENRLCEAFYTNDGKTYKFDIRKGVMFHDGSELTPEDVAASIELARVSGNYADRLSIITAAYVIEGSVYMELTRPNYNLPLLLDVPIVKAGSGEDAVPVGTGPYHYVDAGEYKYLKAFDGHRDFAGLPIERIYLKEYSGGELITAFDSGLIDLVTTSKADINYLEFSGNTESRQKDTTILYFLGVNDQNKFLSDKNRRVLFSSMIDRELLSKDVITAVPTTIPLHPSAYFCSVEYDPFSIREQELEAAGIQYLVEDYDADGMLEFMDLDAGTVEEISLKLVVNKENPTKLEAAHALSESLGERGISVTVTELSWSSYIRALKNKDYDLYYGEVMLTADFDLTQLLCYGGNANYGLYDPKLQSLIYDFNSSGSESKQDAAAALYGYIAENLPIISLMFEIETVYTHRETVSGMAPAAHNIFSDITAWSIDVESF